jgi:hypothetical protein
VGYYEQFVRDRHPDRRLIATRATRRSAKGTNRKSDRLGRWLAKHENTIAAGLKLTIDRSGAAPV